MTGNLNPRWGVAGTVGIATIGAIGIKQKQRATNLIKHHEQFLDIANKQQYHTERLSIRKKDIMSAYKKKEIPVSEVKRAFSVLDKEQAEMDKLVKSCTVGEQAYQKEMQKATNLKTKFWNLFQPPLSSVSLACFTNNNQYYYSLEGPETLYYYKQFNETLNIFSLFISSSFFIVILYSSIVVPIFKYLKFKFF